jgi:hypothetical protein
MHCYSKVDIITRDSPPPPPPPPPVSYQFHKDLLHTQQGTCKRRDEHQLRGRSHQDREYDGHISRHLNTVNCHIH